MPAILLPDDDDESGTVDARRGQGADGVPKPGGRVQDRERRRAAPDRPAGGHADDRALVQTEHEAKIGRQVGEQIDLGRAGIREQRGEPVLTEDVERRLAHRPACHARSLHANDLTFSTAGRTMPVVKVTLVGGAGGVGASVAFNLVLMRRDDEIVLVDNRPKMITSHLMDLDQTLELSPGARLRSGDAGDARDADVVVLLSATPLTVGTSRLEYPARNAAIADALVAPSDGVVVVVTNPVDPLVTRLQQRTGLDRRRILGYTINDSLRLRTGLTRALGVAPGSVDAWVVGEHGELSVPLFDRVRVDGVAVRPTPVQAAAAEEY